MHIRLSTVVDITHLMCLVVQSYVEVFSSLLDKWDAVLIYKAFTLGDQSSVKTTSQ